MIRNTISLNQIALLKEAVDLAEQWKGGMHPDEWDSFEEGIIKMRIALKQIQQDRTNLRKRMGNEIKKI